MYLYDYEEMLAMQNYIDSDVEAIRDFHLRLTGFRGGKVPEMKVKIKKVIFNDPATIVFWNDGTKTVVKCQTGDMFDEEKGLAMACAKKLLGNTGNYCTQMKKFLPKDEMEIEHSEAYNRVMAALSSIGKIGKPIASFKIEVEE